MKLTLDGSLEQVAHVYRKKGVFNVNECLNQIKLPILHPMCLLHSCLPFDDKYSVLFHKKIKEL